jgi:hypothetical protein
VLYAAINDALAAAAPTQPQGLERGREHG